MYQHQKRTIVRNVRYPTGEVSYEVHARLLVDLITLPMIRDKLFGPASPSLDPDGKPLIGWRWEPMIGVGVHVERAEDVALIVMMVE